MSDYTLALINICLTMATLIVIVGGCGTLAVIVLAIKRLIKEELK